MAIKKKNPKDSELITNLKNEFKDELMMHGEDQVSEFGLLNQVPLSERTKKDLKDLTPAMQSFLLRFMDVKEEAIVKATINVVSRKNITDSKKLNKDVAEILAQNQRILEHAANTEIFVKQIKEDHEKRIKELERYAGFWQAVKRRAITIIFAMLLMTCVMYIFRDFYYWLIHREARPIIENVIK